MMKKRKIEKLETIHLMKVFLKMEVERTEGKIEGA